MLPLALAYGVASGLGPIAGMHGAIALGLLAALAGGTPTMISGPTAPMAIVMTVVIAQHADNLSEVFTIVAMAGVMQIALAALGVGRYVSFTPYSVISGFMTGVGVVVIVLQTRPFMGLPVIVQGGVLDTVRSWPETAANINLEALTVGGFALVVAATWPRRFQGYVPSVLAALIVSTLLSVLWFGDAPLIDSIPDSLPMLNLPETSFNFLMHAIQPATTIALVGSIDTLLTAVVARSMTGHSLNPDRDLFGQGIGTLATGFVGGLPGGASVCTVANIRAGAQTRVAGVLCALVLLALVLGLNDYAESIPHAALAGILMKIGWDFIDWRFFTRIRHVQREHLVVMLLTLVLTAFVDLIAAIALGLVFSALSSARQLERLELDNVVSTPLLDHTFLGPSHSRDNQFRARVGLVRLKGRFTVASSQKLVNIIGADIRGHEVLILDFSDTAHIDDSAALVVEHMVDTAVTHGINPIVCGLDGQPKTCLMGLGVLRRIPEGSFVKDLDEARSLAIELLANPA